MLSRHIWLNSQIGFYAGENVQATRWLSYKRKYIFGWTLAVLYALWIFCQRYGWCQQHVCVVYARIQIVSQIWRMRSMWISSKYKKLPKVHIYSCIKLQKKLVKKYPLIVWFPFWYITMQLGNMSLACASQRRRK